MRQFMRSLIRCSEKAACIARACRNEKDLFQLLVEVSLANPLLTILKMSKRRIFLGKDGR